METQKGVLESFCYESSKHSMENIHGRLLKIMPKNISQKPKHSYFDFQILIFKSLD